MKKFGFCNFFIVAGILDESFSSEEYLSKSLLPGPKGTKLRKVENILDDEDMFIQDIFGDDVTSVDENEYIFNDKQMHRQRELERNHLYEQYASGTYRQQQIQPNLFTRQELSERSPKPQAKQQRRSPYEFDSIISDKSNIEDENYDFDDEDMYNIESPRNRITMSPIGLSRVPLHEAFKWLDDMVPQIGEPQRRRHRRITRREPFKRQTLEVPITETKEKKRVQTKIGDETLIEYKIISPRVKKQKYITGKQSISKLQSSSKKLFKNSTGTQLKVKKNTPESYLNIKSKQSSFDQLINSLCDKKLKDQIKDQINQLSDNKTESVRKYHSTNRIEPINTSRGAITTGGAKHKVNKNTPESNLGKIESNQSTFDQFINSLSNKSLKKRINDQLNQLSDNEKQFVCRSPSTNRGEPNNISQRSVDLKRRILQGAIPKRKKST